MTWDEKNRIELLMFRMIIRLDVILTSIGKILGSLNEDEKRI